MHQHHHDHDTAAAGSGTPQDDMAMCPVMDMAVSKHHAEENGLVREYQGKTLYLCCNTCTGLFDKDPARYAGVDKE